MSIISRNYTIIYTLIILDPILSQSIKTAARRPNIKNATYLTSDRPAKVNKLILGENK